MWHAILDSAQVNQIVRTYLQKKNYTNALRSFEKDAGTTGGILNLSLEKDLSLEGAVASQILFFNSAENTPQAYHTAFVQLRDWVESSLDIYKAELHRILYPVFVYSFIELCEKAQWAEARRFAVDHAGGHDEMHQGDMQSLTSISSKDHLEENELAKLFRSNRLWFRMSKHSFDLLLAFLQERRKMLILSIINCRLHIEVYPGPPRAVTQEMDEQNVLFERVHRNEEKMKKHELNWGMSAREPYYPRSLKQMQELNGMQSDGSDDEADDAAQAADKNKKKEEKSKRLDPAHLPPTDESVEEDVIKELRQQRLLSTTSLPSICFHTYLNTAQGLNCVDLARDATTAVAGFSDSAVRLYRFAAAKGVREMREENGADDMEDDRAPADDINAPDVEPGRFHTLTGHAGPVYGVSLDIENDYCVSCGDDSTARLWSLRTLSNLVVYKGHNFPVWDVDISPLGYYFATASHDRTARLWSTEHVYPLRVFAGHLSDVETVKFHPNCNYVATGSADKTVRLWDVQSGNAVRLMVGHRGPVECLSFSPNGRLLASGGGDGQVCIWDIASGKKMRTLSCRGLGAVHSVDFAADGRMLASGHHRGAVCLWDMDGVHKMLPGTEGGGDQPNGASPNVAVEESGERSDPSEQGLLHTACTRFTPVFNVTFTYRNLLLGSGPFVHPSPSKSMRQW